MSGTVVDFVPHDFPLSRAFLKGAKGRWGAAPFLDISVLDRPRFVSEISDINSLAIQEWNSLSDDLTENEDLKACRALLNVLDHHYPARVSNREGKLLLTCSTCYGHGDTIGIEWPCDTFRSIAETK
jgi:hypothetical protein